MVRAPKLHLLDSGLACYLLGIGSAEELRYHSLRGPIFESWVVGEVVKALHNAGERPRVFHYRDARRLEVDLVVERATAGRIELVEVKSGATVAGDWFGPLRRLARLVKRVEADREIGLTLVYGGDVGGVREGVRCVPWSEAPAAGWA